MQRSIYPNVGELKPTGRRRERADCSDCDWFYEAEAPIQQAARQHVRDLSHTVYLCRAQEYVIEPSMPHNAPRI